MSKQGATEIVCVIDKSGSMESIKNDAIGGFNSFLESQKRQPGEARMTVVLFDTAYSFFTDGERIENVKPLNDKTYCPGGCTALLDAVGRTIDEVGRRLSGTPEENRPERLIFVILTDGEENASVEYSRELVFGKIKHQAEKYRWQFLFLAANQDAITSAKNIGIQKDFAVSFEATPQGIHDTYGIVNRAVSAYRSKGDIKED